jgi:hypothetical protein
MAGCGRSNNTVARRIEVLGIVTLHPRVPDSGSFEVLEENII